MYVGKARRKTRKYINFSVYFYKKKSNDDKNREIQDILFLKINKI